MADDEEDDAHHAHRSGWHNLYRVDQQVPMRFDRPMPAPAPPPPKKKPPPPPRKRDDDYAEFMQFTGVTDPDVAKRHVDAARAAGMTLRDAVRWYFDHGGEPVDSAFVRALVALGFDRDLALRAEASGMDPEAAKAWCALVRDLVAMGFDVDLACRAASLCRDVESAAEWCLEQQRAPPRRGRRRRRRAAAETSAGARRADFALRRAAAAAAKAAYAAPPAAPAPAPPPPASMPMGGEAPAAASTLAYGDVAWEGGLRGADRNGGALIGDVFAGTKKSFGLWGAYVVPESKDRAACRDSAFAVYRSDDDVLRGGRSLAGVAASGERDQLCLLAAEDDGDRGRWVCDLLRAAGRSGVILRTPSPNLQMMELRCVYGDEPLKLGCCVVGHAVLVRTLDRDEGAGSAGVQVGDELVEVNGVLVPPIDAGAVTKILDAAHRPLELKLRRPTDPRRHADLARSAIHAKTGEVAEDLRKRESLEIGAALRNDAEDRRAHSLRLEAEARAARARAAPGGEPAAGAGRRGRRRGARRAARRRRGRRGPGAGRPAGPSARSRSSGSSTARRGDGPGRRALALRAPGLDLAALYDRVQRGGQEAHDLQQRAPAPAPAPTVGALADAFEGVSVARRATATFEFAASDDWMLALVPGERLEVLKTMDDGWSEVRNAAGVSGLVPTGCFELEGGGGPVRV
ncbi:hypothetical protein JL721_6904 [Aureococcus anophagefferens]|nr:hypothetical protein JL721_6904 [Aureococcus anophagefferens]